MSKRRMRKLPFECKEVSYFLRRESHFDESFYFILFLNVSLEKGGKKYNCASCIFKRA